MSIRITCITTMSASSHRPVSERSPEQLSASHLRIAVAAFAARSRVLVAVCTRWPTPTGPEVLELAHVVSSFFVCCICAPVLVRASVEPGSQRPVHPGG
jgi:hypothetical protein